VICVTPDDSPLEGGTTNTVSFTLRRSQLFRILCRERHRNHYLVIALFGSRILPEAAQPSVSGCLSRCSSTTIGTTIGTTSCPGGPTSACLCRHGRQASADQRREDGPDGAGPSRRWEKVWRADLRVGRGRERDGPGGAGPSRRCDRALEGRPPPACADTADRRRPIKTWRHGRLARRRGRFK
jgi:hypothetical protein